MQTTKSGRSSWVRLMKIGVSATSRRCQHVPHAQHRQATEEEADVITCVGKSRKPDSCANQSSSPRDNYLIIRDTRGLLLRLKANLSCEIHKYVPKDLLLYARLNERSFPKTNKHSIECRVSPYKLMLMPQYLVCSGKLKSRYTCRQQIRFIRKIDIVTFQQREAIHRSS